MAKADASLVISHWYKLIENFQASPMAFYSSVEAAIERRQIPDTSTSRVDWKEGGLLSARREYLRITRGKLTFDICGAPFGTGFFFSWWLAEVPAAYGLLHVFLILILVLVLIYMIFAAFGFLTGVFLTIVVLPLTFLLLGNAVRQGKLGSEEVVLAIPMIGALYDRIFKPNTYYKIDTALMFQSTVHAAVLEVIDELTSAKGLRALSELERKPILREFFKR